MKITPPKKILLAKGWTQNEIVQATGRHKGEVSAVLNGSRYTRTVQEDIARVVGMPLEELFGLWAWSNRRRKKTQILEEVNDAVFLVDIKTGFILDANTRAEMLLGIPVEEIIGKHHTQMYPVEERERTNKLFQEYAQLKHSVTSEDIFVQHKDGRRSPVEISSSVIELGGKKVTLGIFRDVTERKQTEEKLQAMARVFMDATDAIVIEDLHRKIVDVNAEAERVCGWTREELLGNSIDMIIPQERQKLQLALRPLCLQGKDVRSVECLRHNKSGRMFKVLLTLSLLTNEAGKPIAIATIAKDITTLKKVEEII